MTKNSSTTNYIDALNQKVRRYDAELADLKNMYSSIYQEFKTITEEANQPPAPTIRDAVYSLQGAGNGAAGKERGLLTPTSVPKFQSVGSQSKKRKFEPGKNTSTFLFEAFYQELKKPKKVVFSKKVTPIKKSKPKSKQDEDDDSNLSIKDLILDGMKLDLGDSEEQSEELLVGEVKPLKGIAMMKKSEPIVREEQEVRESKISRVWAKGNFAEISFANFVDLSVFEQYADSRSLMHLKAASLFQMSKLFENNDLEVICKSVQGVSRVESFVTLVLEFKPREPGLTLSTHLFTEENVEATPLQLPPNPLTAEVHQKFTHRIFSEYQLAELPRVLVHLKRQNNVEYEFSIPLPFTINKFFTSESVSLN